MQGVASGSWPALAGAPTIGTATAGALSASVTFTAPTYVGSGITGYTATSSPGGITGTGASSPVTVSGLTAGTAYTFTVTATTAGGQGPASAASNSVTPTAPSYIEDVFSTYLYAGDNSTQTITNGINLSANGGMVWIKSRTDTSYHGLWDTNRGAGKYIGSNTTMAQGGNTGDLLGSFNSNGFAVNTTYLSAYNTTTNASGQNYVSWTFRKQPKFFDVVTYTGTSSAQNIAHNLGSTPACIIVKKLNDVSIWPVYHSSLGGADKFLTLNTTDAADSAPSLWNNTAPTSTQFTVGTSGSTNGSGNTFVAYLFAHDAGGFGVTGSDNVISCGSFTTNGSGNVSQVSLGYEPQWVLYKTTDVADNWRLVDSMRGMPVTAPTGEPVLKPNTSAAEQADAGVVVPNATGFSINGGSPSFTYIYIAIRRGPMKVPTDATKVFAPVTYTGDGSSTRDLTFGFPVDMFLVNYRGVSAQRYLRDRLRSGTVYLSTPSTSAEAASYTVGFDSNTGINDIPPAWDNASGFTFVDYGFGRAPSFFDEVCFTYANTTNERITHNLGVAPQLIIVKSRSDISAWPVYIATSALSSGGIDKYIYLSQGNSLNTNTNTWGTSNPTSTDFGMSPSLFFSAGQTLVAYLFATCAGVSKVGSYTGTGSTQTIACGFTGGARFVLIKRTDTDGYGWSVFDTARGMVSGTDPYLFLNSTAAEVNADNVYTTTGGFQLVSAAGITNASGGTYIFLAIA
jgi:hypothetical protein